jgi:hypothetical protein
MIFFSIFILNKKIMNTVELKKKSTQKKAVKKFNPAKFLGLVKWDEDAVKYQRRLRDGK